MTEWAPPMRVTVARRMLALNECESQVAGHVSVRADGEDAFWVTGFQYFEETRPEDVSKVSFDLETLEGSLEASPGIKFHRTIYVERPDVGSVIHIHSFWVSVFATRRRLLGMYNVESVLFHEDQALFEDDGTRPPVLGERMVEALGPDKNVLFMKNHGALITAPTLEQATVKAFTLERCCHIQCMAEAIDGSEFPIAYAEQTRGAYEQHFLPQMWAANVRRLQRHEPELFAPSSSTPDPSR